MSETEIKQLSLPKYSEETELLPVTRFCATVDRFRVKNEWSDEKTASSASEALRGKAALWLENVTKESPGVVEKWSTLKPRLVERWNRVRSTSEKAKLLFNLMQRNTETSDDFYDRVNANVKIVTDEPIQNFTGANKEAKTEGAREVTELFCMYLFVNGLNENIYIPLGTIHRIENPYTKPVKIIEAQIGSILKESDIVRYKDIYGRIN